ncbi:glycosyltransferase [Corynebacterium cystitidis]|uniref:glycosyltransferase n=1 Tax=Corynebacterium cystitidis TaxID=35757 RepID=UPI00211F2654|nr:glycosyltransferase [Corynebacterium cystitidis]
MVSPITALMSIYARTQPAELRVALDSLAAQTLPAARIIVVIDGPVPDELRTLIDEYPNAVAHPLEDNQGLGAALAAGLEQVDTEFVARLDSDDIAFPDRFEKQVEFLRNNPDIAVVGTAVQEFDDTIFSATGQLEASLGEIRRLPEDPSAYAKLNSPLNHPSVMMRTADVRAVGGYRHLPFIEDYDLWARLLADGKKLHNMAEPLTYFRVSDAQLARRTDKKMLRSEIQLQKNLASYGLVSRPRAAANLVVRTTYRMLPTAVLRKVNELLFHR